MRITDKDKLTFVNKVLEDTTNVDYYALAEAAMRKDVEEQIPKAIRDLLANPLTEPYIANFYVRSTAAGSFCGISVKGAYEIKPTTQCDEQLVALQKLINAQFDRQRALRAELLGAISKCRSTQQISKLFPELDKYLPKDPWLAAESPPVTQVVQHLVDAGWPVSEKS